MAFTFGKQCNSFIIWWQNTYASIETLLPLLQEHRADLSASELASYQNLAYKAAMHVQRDVCPCYAQAIQAQLISTLCNLQMSLAAQAAHESQDARSYFHLARSEWTLVEMLAAQQGIKLKAAQSGA